MTENSDRRAWIETLLLLMVFFIAGLIWPVAELLEAE